MAPTEVDLDQVYAFTVNLAKEAGKRILEGSAKRTSHAASVDNPNTKKNRVDRQSHATPACARRVLRAPWSARCDGLSVGVDPHMMHLERVGVVPGAYRGPACSRQGLKPSALPAAVVTETDQAVEAYIKDSIAQTYPDFRFIGEESYAGGERVELTDEPTFIVDPIDGTTNFVRSWRGHAARQEIRTDCLAACRFMASTL